MSEGLSARQALMVLNGLPNIGPISLTRLLEHFNNDAPAILKAGRRELTQVQGIGDVTANTVTGWRQHFNLEREEELREKHGVAYITLLDESYPALLKEIYDSPIGLYVRGEYRFTHPCIAIVGTRRPTLYGRSVAKRLAGDLCRLGFCVVSGMARGIDSEAHEGALEAGGKTVAVLGCGLDIIYPPENLELYRRISKEGAVISEFPFGRRADRQTFPMRNRVIAGLSHGVVVVESDMKGGSMITARFAGEQGRQVFAVPGRIDQPASRGCNQLIRDGATLLSSVDDLLQEFQYLGQLELGQTGPQVEQTRLMLAESLTDAQQAVAQCFADGGIYHPDTLTDLTELPLQEVTASLMVLELNRIVVRRADGSYEGVR